MVKPYISQELACYTHNNGVNEQGVTNVIYVLLSNGFVFGVNQAPTKLDHKVLVHLTTQYQPSIN